MEINEPIALQLDIKEYRMIIYRPDSNGLRAIHIFKHNEVVAIISLSKEDDYKLFDFMLSDLEE